MLCFFLCSPVSPCPPLPSPLFAAALSGWSQPFSIFVSGRDTGHRHSCSLIILYRIVFICDVNRIFEGLKVLENFVPTRKPPCSITYKPNRKSAIFNLVPIVFAITRHCTLRNSSKRIDHIDIKVGQCNLKTLLIVFITQRCPGGAVNFHVSPWNRSLSVHCPICPKFHKFDRSPDLPIRSHGYCFTCWQT